MNVTLEALCLLMTVISISTPSQAQETKKSELSKAIPPMAKTMHRSELAPSIGASLGIASPEASFRTSAEYGVNAAMQIWKPISLGIDITGISSERMSGPQTQDLHRTSILITGTLNLTGDVPIIKHSFVGLGVGPVIDTASYQGTHSGIAPVLGFDFPIDDQALNDFTIGMAAKYVFVSGPSPDSVSVNGALKYWF